MLEQVDKLGFRPQCLGADKAYGSGEFLAWLLAREIQPHIPVIDRRHQTQGHFTREQFRYEPTQGVLDVFCSYLMVVLVAIGGVATLGGALRDSN